MTHRVKHKHVYRLEEGEMVRYDVGDGIEPTEQALELHPDRYEKIQEPSSEPTEPDDSEDESDESGQSVPFDPTDLNTRELRNFDGEYDQETLDKLHELEASGKDRQTAHDLMERHATGE